MLYILMPLVRPPKLGPYQRDQRYGNLTADKVDQWQHPRVFESFRLGIFRSELRLSTSNSTGRQQT